jgi:hypothetical protein
MAFLVSPSKNSGPSESRVPKVSYEKYVDPTGEFGSKKLKYSIWYVEHRVFLYRCTVGLLALIIIVSWGYSLWQWGNYVIYGIAEDTRVAKVLTTFVNYTTMRDRLAPVPLQINGTELLAGGVNKYDSIAEVSNMNNRFFVEFDYYFIVGEGTTPKQHSFLLPQESRPLAYLGLETNNTSGGTALVLENIKWQRISSHDIPDTALWQAEHLNFIVDDFVFTRSENTTGVLSHSLEFTLKNATPYDYALPQFYVGLYLQQSLVGVIPLTVPKFKSLETRTIDLRSFVPNLSVSEVKVFPIINIYDQEVYLAPER